jgi:triphosphoribosyl-dephospho-CoA synthase
VLAATRELGLGSAILEATTRTTVQTSGNTNLGMILLLAPLAAVPPGVLLKDGVRDVLAKTTVEDARFVYRAIRLACPGGLGRVAEQDVLGTPDVSLRETMCLAKGRDRVAAQYANGFADVLDRGVPHLLDWSRRCADWERAVVGLHLSLLSELPDTLIARKCGSAVADDATSRARAILAAGWPESDEGQEKLEDFDRWLRGDGHRRNPGTTADLVAAALFAALRDHHWRPRGVVV